MVVSRLLRFTSTNVFTNLAGEERLFERVLDRSLLFYVNSSSVVLGRTQNPFNEVDVAYAAQHAIPIARRRSGGGTVVHDAGNLNFCFIRPRHEHEPLSNARLVASVLRDEFGIKATVNDRADILVDGMKVSGAAYRISKDRAYHHGTLLINSDLAKLRRLLKTPLRKGIEAMGTASIPSPVTNLSEHYSGTIDADAIVEAVAERFSRTTARVKSMSPALVERTFGGLQAERGELCSHAWVYGKTPRFTYECRVGNTMLRFKMTKGMAVHHIEARSAESSGSDREEKELAEILTTRLRGKPFDGKVLADEVRAGLGGGGEGIDTDMEGKVAAVLEEEIPAQFWKEDASLEEEEYN